MAETSLVAHRTSKVRPWYTDKNKLLIVKNGPCVRANDAQFNEFVHICEHTKLDPLLGQIYCFVFNKGTPDEKMVAVIGIGGYRSIAERSGLYMPSDKEPRITKRKDLIDKGRVRPANPLGLVSATAYVKKRDDTGEWHSFSGKANWLEYAPLKPLCYNYDDERNAGGYTPSGEYYLDPSKKNWLKMPELLLVKCAEAAALRKGWPEDYSNLYAMEEIDRMKALDLTPAEYARVGQADATQRAYGIGAAVIWQWEDSQPMISVGVDKWQSEVMKFIDSHRSEPQVIMNMWDRNRLGFAEIWKHDKGLAFEVRDQINLIRDKMLGRRSFRDRTGLKDRTPPRTQTIVTSSRDLEIGPSPEDYGR